MRIILPHPSTAELDEWDTHFDYEQLYNLTYDCDGHDIDYNSYKNDNNMAMTIEQFRKVCKEVSAFEKTKLQFSVNFVNDNMYDPKSPYYFKPSALTVRTY